MDEEINALVKRIKLGDKEAFAELYRQTVRYIYSVVYAYLLSKEDTEDVVQDTYLKLYMIRKRLKLEKSVLLYMKRIAINYAFKKLNSRKKFSRPVQAKYPVEAEKAEIIKETMKRLEDKDRMVIVLHYLSNSSIKEISFLLGESESSIKTRLFRARNRMREVMKHELP